MFAIGILAAESKPDVRFCALYIFFNCLLVILCIRTWAVWHQNKWVGLGLTMVLLGTFVIECIYLVQITTGVQGSQGECCLISAFTLHVWQCCLRRKNSTGAWYSPLPLKPTTYPWPWGVFSLFSHLSGGYVLGLLFNFKIKINLPSCPRFHVNQRFYLLYVLHPPCQFQLSDLCRQSW